MEKYFRDPNAFMKAVNERYQKLDYIDTDACMNWGMVPSNLAKESEKKEQA